MRRFYSLLLNELKLARTSIPVHLVAIVQPTLMYFLMTLVLVQPTFDVNILRPGAPAGDDLLAAMERVGTSSGVPYINPVIVADPAQAPGGQVVAVETGGGEPTAVQRFMLVDSNMVKNFRNRLTSAALVMWNETLGDQAITIEEHPLLPHDVPYKVYFGLAMLPLATFLAVVMIGGYATAQDFEFGTIQEYRMAPIPPGQIIAARLARLVITGWLSAGVLLLTMGLLVGVWPDSPLAVALILLPVAVVGGCIGFTVGLVMQKTLPAFVIALAASFATWLLGGAFGLPAGFDVGYEVVSRFTPNAHAVELLFPHFYGLTVGSPGVSAGLLVVFCAVGLLLVGVTYRRRIVALQG